MNSWQLLLLVFSLFNLGVFAKAYRESKKGNAYGLTTLLQPLGMYVWGDAFIFSLFWALVSAVCVVLADVYLFFLILSLFWVVRSFGETIYWFNQQFSSLKKEAPENIPLYSIFQNDSVWFIQQIRNQCITVIALVASIYFAALWITALPL